MAWSTTQLHWLCQNGIDQAICGTAPNIFSIIVFSRLEGISPVLRRLARILLKDRGVLYCKLVILFAGISRAVSIRLSEQSRNGESKTL
jgi:hypothetical protein